MELMQEAKRCSDSREEDLLEEEEELVETSHNKESCKQYYPFSSSSSSPSNLWLGMLHHHDHHSPESTTPCDSHNSSSGLGLHHLQDAPTNTNSNSALYNNPRKHLHLMDLSLGNKEDDVVEANFHGATINTNDLIEKEHMFDKAVTPSDVGKLNRLVIPKQHAERYFPLDASTNEKGLLLNFEDRNGKLWRFRYSYWNSSQSYVMTKGWSRFVKEKKLDAGDIVSFQRGLGEMYRHRLYIDWRRRPDHTGIGGGGGLDHHHHPVANSLITPFFVPNQYSIRWGGRLYSVPTAAPRHQPVNYNNYPFQEPQLPLQPQQPQYQQVYSGSSHGGRYNNELNLGSGSLYCLRSTTPGDRNLPGRHEGGGSIAPVIIDSVPVAHGKSSACSSITRATDTCGKRLRLFGVNMECSSSSLPSASIPQNLQCLRKSNEEEELEEEEEEVPICSSSAAAAARFGDQKGETSVLFDLNPSFQYRR